MSDMIERCARATFECRPYGDEHSERGIPSWETLSEDWRESHRKLARAAIEAMREPTAEMIDAGVRSEWGGTLGTRVANSYRDMIDAALSQDTHSLPSEDR